MARKKAVHSLSGWDELLSRDFADLENFAGYPLEPAPLRPRTAVAEAGDAAAALVSRTGELERTTLLAERSGDRVRATAD